MSIGRFYAMIGALLWDAQTERYLVLKRSPEKDIGAGEWECVTGRVDQGESYPEACHREVREELGVEIQIDFILRTEHFYRGEPIPENEMVGVMYCCSLENPNAIQLSWEHSEARWVTAAEAAELFPSDHWLLAMIQRAEQLRAHISEDLLAYYRESVI
jgi:8-oxo-dGTP pyrophosphatase MutT (NUDIX family)